MKTKISLLSKLSLILLLTFSFSLFTFNSFAQGVSINSTGNEPDAAAVLDVSSTTTPFQGLLLPRLTTEQRNAIATPIPESLLIYNTTTKCYEGYNANTTTWIAFGCIGCVPSGATASASSSSICAGSTLTLTGVATDATSWSWSGPNSFTSTLQSPTITNITTDGTGVYTLAVSNNCGSVTANTVWVTVNTSPTASTAGIHIPSEIQIIWNWNVVSGATGYKWNITNDYGTATDMGVSTSKTETGLTSVTEYTRYVWAYNDCGESNSLVLSKTTNAEGDVTNPTTGKVWMDRNLGASQVATSSTDEDSYGDLYQWGRDADGHESRTSGTTTTLSSDDTPEDGNFILEPVDSPYDWRSSQNNYLWQGVSGTNNPCPSGYRLPTKAEWIAEYTSWGTDNNATGAFASPLKLPAAGAHCIDGNLGFEGSLGYYWSSTVSGTNSWYLVFVNDSEGFVCMFDYHRSGGYSVRCIKD